MRIVFNKYIILCAAGTMLFLTCFAQNNAESARTASPSYSDNADASLFTGQLSYTIPIYTLNDPDFPLEIALRYHTNGFKPFQPSGYYGLDWSLICGGYITRSVQGLPDTQNKTYQQEFEQIKKYLGMYEALSNYGCCSPNLVYNFSSTAYDTCGYQYIPDSIVNCYNKMDYMPDIFNFNFCGYQGRFILDNNNQPVIISGDFVFIDMSESSECYTQIIPLHSADEHPANSKITLKTKNGYTFLFGGFSNAIEYDLVTEKNMVSWQEKPMVNAWYLTQIIAPNGRTMDFQYRNESSFYYDRNDMRFFTTNYDWGNEPILNDTIHLVHLLQKKCLLQSITISDLSPFTINFHSSSETHKRFEHPAYTQCFESLQVDSITVSYGDNRLKTASLSYAYRKYNPIYGASHNYYWRYLSSVHISGEGTYSLSYNNIDPYPETVPPFMHLYTYPDLDIQNDTAYIEMVDRFGFWRMSSLQGLLSTVSLPTGGNVHFTYGTHDYREERRFRKVNIRDVELYSLSTSERTIGGARIEKIETFSDFTTLVETQTFSYDKPGTTMSSGIFYNIYYLYNSTNDSVSIVNPYNYGMIDSHIGYSYVQRTTTIDNTSYKTSYTFDTGHDSYASDNPNSMINRNYNIEGYTISKELRSGSLTYHPQLLQTGKLLATKQYNGNSLQRATYYRYNGIPNSLRYLPEYDGVSIGCTDTIVCLFTDSCHVARKLLVIPNVLEQVVSYEYSDNPNDSALVSSLSFTYDTLMRKKQIINTDSRSIKHFTRYTYPDNITSNPYTPTGLLVKTGRISLPMEEVSGYWNNNLVYITAGTIHLYEKEILDTYVNPNPIPNIFGGSDSVNLGGYVYYPYLYQTRILALTSPLPGQSYQPLSNSGLQLVYDSHYHLTNEYYFDSLFRLLSVKPLGKMETRYTWDGIYPITQITGDQTWTYTYIPFVGIQTVTDPRGNTTYYKYNSVGQLIEEYQLINGKKQILRAYKYHFKTE